MSDWKTQADSCWRRQWMDGWGRADGYTTLRNKYPPIEKNGKTFLKIVLNKANGAFNNNNAIILALVGHQILLWLEGYISSGGQCF